MSTPDDKPLIPWQPGVGHGMGVIVLDPACQPIAAHLYARARSANAESEFFVHDAIERHPLEPDLERIVPVNVSPDGDFDFFYARFEEETSQLAAWLEKRRPDLRLRPHDASWDFS